MALRTKNRPANTSAHPATPGLPQARDRNPIVVVVGAIGRAIVNIIVIAVLAAAGLAGWLAADEYLVPRVVGTISLGAVSDWPPELGAATPWPVQESNWTYADGRRASVIVESSSNTVVAAMSSPGDAAPTLTEWSGPLLAIRPGDAPWQVRAGIEEQAAPRQLLGDLIVSPRLADVLGGGVAGFAIVRETTGQGVGTPADAEIGITRWFEVTVDAEAFRRDDPVAFGRSHPRVSERSGVFTWTIGTDAEGRIMRWEGIVEGASVSLRPVELPELQSPIATQVALTREATAEAGATGVATETGTDLAPDGAADSDAPAGAVDPDAPADGAEGESIDDTIEPTPADEPATGVDS